MDASQQNDKRQHASKRPASSQRPGAKPASTQRAAQKKSKEKKPERSTLSPARVLALQATRQVREREAYSRNCVETLIETSSASAPDRAFATLLTYGVVSTSCVLDEIIDNNLQKPSDIKAKVRDVLRIGVYEMAYLEKSSYVVVSQGVELVRTVAPKAAGLVNVVLRKIALSLETFPWGDPETDDEALARAFGYPYWMVKRIIEDRGREATFDILQATEATAPVFIAVNPFKTTDEAVLASLQEIDPAVRSFGVPGCYRTYEAQQVVKSDLLGNGSALVADASSQMVALLAKPSAGEDFLEVASGRGTKSILLQGNTWRSQGELAHIYALDIYPFKSKILSERMVEYAVPQVTAVTGDATDLDAIEDLPPLFSGAFIDAPCTGLGTLRRHAEQRMRVTQDDVDALAELGFALLESVSRRIAHGGFIVYATCTLTRAENEDLIARFLKSEAGNGFFVRPFSDELPIEFEGCITAEGYFQSHPCLHGADGHFAAKLVRI